MRYGPKTILGRQFGLPQRSDTGKYSILIVTSARLLRWPYSKLADPPKYNTKEEAKKILKAYLSFANTNQNTLVKRVIEEFEIVEVTKELLELNT